MLPYLNKFYQYLQENSYSEETIYSYKRDLMVFDNFLLNNKLEFNKINKQIIDQYKNYLNSIDRKTADRQKIEKALKGRSINRLLSSIKKYLSFLIEMDHYSPISPEVVKFAKLEKNHPQVAELIELVKLIESPSYLEKSKEIALRNRAMLETLFSTGMRISELLNLKRSEIDDSGRILITGKGRTQRFVYLTEKAQKHLNDYLVIRTDNLPNLFIPYRGSNTNKTDKKISTNYLQAKIKEYREKLKINLPISANSLRQGFATFLAEKEVNPVAIQILLGHESLDNIGRYVHASDRKTSTAPSTAGGR